MGKIMSNIYFGEFISYGRTIEFSTVKKNRKFSSQETNLIMDEIYEIIDNNLRAYYKKRFQDDYMIGYKEYNYVSFPFISVFVKDFFKKTLKASDISFSLAFEKAILEFMKKPERNIFWQIGKNESHEYYLSQIIRLKNAIKKQIDRLMMRKYILDIEDNMIVVVNRFEKEYLYDLPYNILGFVCRNFDNYDLTMDLSLAYEIPIVITTRNVSKSEFLLINGVNKTLHLNPKEAVISKALDNKKQYTFELGEEPKYKSDVIKYYASFVDKRSIEKAKSSTWYAGVGLFRTEYLYITKGYLPTLKEQVELFVDLMEAFEDRPINIRIPDLNELKRLDYEENVLTEVFHASKYGRVYHTNVLAIYEASKITNKKVTIFIPMLRMGKEIDRWKHRFDGFLGVNMPEHLKPKFGIMMETESAFQYYEDYRYVDSVVFGLNDFLEEAMDKSRHEKIDFEEFMLEVWLDLQGAHQYFRRNGIKLLHIVSGNILRQPEILRKFIKKGFKHFCIPLSYIKIAEKVLYEHESTRGLHVGVHAKREKAKHNK